MDNILRSRKTEVPPSIDEFVAGIVNIEHEVHERLVLTREWQQRSDKNRRIVGNLSPRKFAYLSTEGITLPWVKHRTIKKLRQEFYGPFKILRHWRIANSDQCPSNVSFLHNPTYIRYFTLTY
jgi:hypothetical protein